METEMRRRLLVASGLALFLIVGLVLVASYIEPRHPIELEISAVEQHILAKFKSNPAVAVVFADQLFPERWQSVCFGDIDRVDDDILRKSLINKRFKYYFDGERGAQHILFVVGVSSHGNVEPIILPNVTIQTTSDVRWPVCASVASMKLRLERVNSVVGSTRYLVERVQ
jgi:hypothetical protein